MMQTFFPLENIHDSAKALDRQRLGKQRVEGLQLLYGRLGLHVITSVETGPRIETYDKLGSYNHPASKMWDGFEAGLGVYTLAMCEEWVRRGYMDTVRFKVKLLLPGLKSDSIVPMPQWCSNEAVRRSHRSNLIKKLPSHYRDTLGWKDPDNLPYIWPESR